jgi:cyclohexanecarboxylate-CoA ligase
VAKPAPFATPGGQADLFADACLAAAAADRPALTAVTDDRAPLTFRQAEDAVAAVAAALRMLGIHHGDVVSWQLPAWHEAYLLHLAVLRIGAVSNPIDTGCRGLELEHLLSRARARLVVVPEELDGFRHADSIARSRPALPELRQVVVARAGRDRAARSFDSLWRHGGRRPEAVHRTPDDAALLVFTAGTGGRPKAVVHTHRSLAHGARAVIGRFGLTAARPLFVSAPLGDVTALVHGVHVPAMLSAPVVLWHSPRPRAALRLIAGHPCSLAVVEPALLRAVAEHESGEDDLSALRALVCTGGEVAGAELLAAGKRLGRPVVRTYGMAEYPALALGEPGEPPTGPRYRLLGDTTRAQVVDQCGEAVPPGVAGELVIAGPGLFSGYLDGSHGTRLTTSDGWFHTGDLVMTVGRDEFVNRGRSADRVVRGGEDLDVADVEDQLRAHARVRDVAVVGMPCPALGQRACAFVVAAAGHRLGLAELRAFLLRRGVPGRRLPERLEVVARLPRTRAGGIQRFRLRELIRTRLIEELFASL